MYRMVLGLPANDYEVVTVRTRGHDVIASGLVVIPIVLCAAAALVAVVPDPDPTALTPARALHPQPALLPRTRLTFPGRQIVVAIRTFEDEIDAYHSLSHLRHRWPGDRFLLTVSADQRLAVLRSELPPNLLTAIPRLNRLREAQIASGSDWAVAGDPLVRDWWDEDRLFRRVYSDLVRPRRRRDPAAVVRAISRASSFFVLPRGAFVPAGSPEHHPNLVWRNRASADQVILARSAGKYLIADRRSAEWEETWKALVQAHALYSADRQRYAALPEGLRPPAVLAEESPGGALVTYAALLLEDLQGRRAAAGLDVDNLFAVPPDDPNERQEVGLRRASLYAERALAHALEVNRCTLMQPAE